MNLLQEFINKATVFELFEVVDVTTAIQQLPLIVDPSQQQGGSIIIAEGHIVFQQQILLDEYNSPLYYYSHSPQRSVSSGAKFISPFLQEFHQNTQKIIIITITLDSMGSICNPKTPSIEQIPLEGDPHHKSTINLTNEQVEKNMEIDFTTEKLIHLSADLLILFMDRSSNIKKSDHFIKLPVQGGKVEEYAKSFIDRTRIQSENDNKDREFITFNIMIPTINFKKVSVIFCDTWKMVQTDKSNLQVQLDKYFESIQNDEYSTIVITEFISELGIPLQTGAKILVKQIMKLNKKPSKITFNCLTEESKHLFIDVVNANKEELASSFISKLSRTSDYF